MTEVYRRNDVTISAFSSLMKLPNDIVSYIFALEYLKKEAYTAFDHSIQSKQMQIYFPDILPQIAPTSKMNGILLRLMDMLIFCALNLAILHKDASQNRLMTYSLDNTLSLFKC